MCGACGRSVVSDPVLGQIRTMRQHLIVAQAINSAAQPWPGAPKVAATSDGWLVSGPTGARDAFATVEAVWSAVLRSCPRALISDLHRVAEGSGAREYAGVVPRNGACLEGVQTEGDFAAANLQSEDLSLRVLNLGYQMARNAERGVVL